MSLRIFCELICIVAISATVSVSGNFTRSHPGSNPTGNVILSHRYPACKCDSAVNVQPFKCYH